LYSVIVLQKAQRVIEELDGSLDGLEIDEIVSSLADNPDPRMLGRRMANRRPSSAMWAKIGSG